MANTSRGTAQSWRLMPGERDRQDAFHRQETPQQTRARERKEASAEIVDRQCWTRYIERGETLQDIATDLQVSRQRVFTRVQRYAKRHGLLDELRGVTANG